MASGLHQTMPQLCAGCTAAEPASCKSAMIPPVQSGSDLRDGSRLRRVACRFGILAALRQAELLVAVLQLAAAQQRQVGQVVLPERPGQAILLGNPLGGALDVAGDQVEKRPAPNAGKLPLAGLASRTVTRRPLPHSPAPRADPADGSID